MPKGVRIGGRAKGTPNKNTTKVREAFATFVDETFWDFKGWVFRVAEQDPKGASDLYLRACEYHIPKARTEFTGPDGGPISFVMNLHPTGDGK